MAKSAAAVSPARERSQPAAALTLDVVEDAGDWGSLGPVDEVVAATARALARHPALATLLPAEASVALSSDARVRALNRQWRKIDKPTNVLSFPASEAHAAAGPRFLGDIVLAAETIAREALALGVPVRHHLQHLVVHGVLHLAGHDHETASEADAMEALEREILATLGVPDPYADSDPVTEAR